jgi:hypothetical protein
MAIVQAELKLYRAETINDTDASNGGAMSINEAASGVANNLLPDVSEAERLAGITRYRKGFYKQENNEDPILSLTSPRIFIPFQTDANDMVVFYPGTQDDTQASTTASTPDQYGCGQLNASISSSAVTCVVAVEDWSESEIFRIDDLVRISDQATVGGAGNEEFVTLTNVSDAGDLITLTWVGGLTNGYTDTETKVSSVYEPALPIVASADASYTLTTTDGTFNEGGYPVEGDNEGGVYDTFTITFDSPYTGGFECIGSISGSIGTGNITTDFTPLNADFSGENYFILRSAGWGGTWLANETMEFTTQPAAEPLWFKQVVPASATVTPGNSFEIAIDGQTA